MEYLSYYLLAIFFLIILKYIFFSSNQNKKLPPSPPSLPIIGHFHLIKTPLHLALSSLLSKHGPIIYLKFGYKKFLVISSPSAIEECFTKQDVIFANRPQSLTGDHLTYNYKSFVWSSYGQYWRILRKLSVIEILSSQSLQKSGIIREENIRALIRVLFKGGYKERVDVNYVSSIFGFNNMMRILVGKVCVREEEILNGVGKEIVKKIRGLFFVSSALGVCDFFPILRSIGYKGIEKNLRVLWKKRDEYLENLIVEVLERKNNEIGEKKGKCFIETMFSLQESEHELYTNEVIKSLILVMIIAGTESSAGTIESSMSLLLSNPNALRKLKQEIDENIGHDHLLNDEDLSKLPYLRCVANEALRLYPPAPMLLPHYSLEDCVVEGYTIPKNTILLVNAFSTHRDPNVWEDPEKFKPERFQDMGEELGYKFIPFGMGRRACPGVGMGLRTISLAVGAFVQCFDWDKVLEHEDRDMNWKEKAKPLEAMCSPRHEAIDLLSQL